MELRVQFLESFMVSGSDGARYKVCAYERQARDASAVADERWEPTGVIEYRLADGRLVDARRDGSMTIANTEVALTPMSPAEAAAG